jgi:hypothetical protein
MTQSTQKVSAVQQNWIMDGIALYFLARLLFPLLKVGLDGYRLSFILFPIWLFLAYKSDSGRQLWKSITCSRGVFIGLCGYSIWLILEMLIQRSPDAARDIGWLIITVPPVYLMGCYYGFHFPDRFWRIARILLAIVGIQAAISLPYLITGVWDPKDVMHGITIYGDTAGTSFMMEAALHGIGGYDLYINTAVLVSIIAGFALYTRRNWLARSLWISAWMFLVLANIVSTFTASALVALLGSVTVLICAIMTRKLAISTTVILFVTMGLVGWLVFNMFLTSDKYTYTSDKLSNIFEAVNKGGVKADPTTRGELLFMSIDAFLESPLIGYGAEGSEIFDAGRGKSGGHSTWLNILVQYGLLGGFWFFLMVFAVGWQIWRAIRMRPGDILAISLMIAYVSFLIYGIINVVMMDVVFFFFLHGGALALQRQAQINQPPIPCAPAPVFPQTNSVH